MKHFLIPAAAMLVLSACQMSGDGASVSRSAAMSASTASEILALGGRQLTADDFRAELVDKDIRGGNWSWVIRSNGTSSSAADDGSWSDDNSAWRLVGNQYCRTVGEEQERCSDVYEAGGVYKFTETGETLSGWSATVS